MNKIYRKFQDEIKALYDNLQYMSGYKLKKKYWWFSLLKAEFVILMENVCIPNEEVKIFLKYRSDDKYMYT